MSVRRERLRAPSQTRRFYRALKLDDLVMNLFLFLEKPEV